MLYRCSADPQTPSHTLEKMIDNVSIESRWCVRRIDTHFAGEVEQKKKISGKPRQKPYLKANYFQIKRNVTVRRLYIDRRSHATKSNAIQMGFFVNDVLEFAAICRKTRVKFIHNEEWIDETKVITNICGFVRRRYLWWCACGYVCQRDRYIENEK